jgi:hypothetical protein
MRKTAKQALEVTKANHGKHFIGDFLPKEEVALPLLFSNVQSSVAHLLSM